MPRDTFRAVTHDVVRCHLAIDQLVCRAFSHSIRLTKRQLGRMGRRWNMDSRKTPPEPDSAQAAYERISGRIMLPHFNGMGKTQFVQAGVGIHHFGHDPRPVLIRARCSRASRHDVAKGLIDGHGKAALAYFLTDGMRDTEFFRKQDAPGIGGPPEQRLAFPVPRENPGAVGRQQTADAQVAADRHKAFWIGPLRSGNSSG